MTMSPIMLDTPYSLVTLSPYHLISDVRRLRLVPRVLQVLLQPRDPLLVLLRLALEHLENTI